MCAQLDLSSYLTLPQAARLCPGKPNAATVWRWARRGLVARNGQQIFLDHVRIGTRVYVTLAALDKFFRETTDADKQHFEHRERPGGQERTPVRRAHRDTLRSRAIADAESILNRAGI